MAQIYVKVSETDKPYIEKVSTEPLEGYEAKNGLLNDQIIALLNYPTKCYVDDNGVVFTPNQIPLSESEKQAQNIKLEFADMKQKMLDMQTTIDNLTTDKTNLQTALNNANTDNNNLKAQIQALQKQALMYTQQIMQINNDLQKAKEGK